MKFTTEEMFISVFLTIATFLTAILNHEFFAFCFFMLTLIAICWIFYYHSENDFPKKNDDDDDKNDNFMCMQK